MPRTTTRAVQGLLGADYGQLPDGTLPDLTPRVLTAGLVVDDLVAAAAARNVTLSAARLEMIERHLAAWYYWVADPPYKSNSTGGASGSYERVADGHKKTAIDLDSSGCLVAILDRKRKASGAWLGKTLAEQIPYWRRN